MGNEFRNEGKLKFPRGLSTLKKANESQNAKDNIQHYLEFEWYRADCGCYENHKSDMNIYYGYWSFEAGAVAKIIGIDDANMQDFDYYPYDLVHFTNS